MRGLLQVQLSNAELTGNINCLQDELEATKCANAQLHMLLADKQQSWREQTLTLKAEHDKQV